MRRLLLTLAGPFLVATSAWSQTTIIDHAPVNLSGTQRITGNIPNGETMVTVLIERNTTDRPTFWPSANTAVNLRTMVLVPGNPWREWCGFSGRGGIDIGRDATETRQSMVRCSLPAGTGRQMEVMLEVSGSPASLVSQVTVIVQ